VTVAVFVLYPVISWLLFVMVPEIVVTLSMTTFAVFVVPLIDARLALRSAAGSAFAVGAVWSHRMAAAANDSAELSFIQLLRFLGFLIIVFMWNLVL